MTEDELFTAIYLVCGALPSQPEKKLMLTSMSTMYRRKLPNNMEQTWLVDEDASRSANYDVRITHDPAYMEYFDKAAKFGITVDEFTRYIAWAEAHEQTHEQRG